MRWDVQAVVYFWFVALWQRWKRAALLRWCVNYIVLRLKAYDRSNGPWLDGCSLRHRMSCHSQDVPRRWDGPTWAISTDCMSNCPHGISNLLLVCVCFFFTFVSCKRIRWIGAYVEIKILGCHTLSTFILKFEPSIYIVLLQLELYYQNFR